MTRLSKRGTVYGALVSNTAVADHPEVRRNYPMLLALPRASQQIRNVATVGGNLLQRTRCPTTMTPPSPATNENQTQAVLH